MVLARPSCVIRLLFAAVDFSIYFPRALGTQKFWVFTTYVIGLHCSPLISAYPFMSALSIHYVRSSSYPMSSLPPSPFLFIDCLYVQDILAVCSPLTALCAQKHFLRVHYGTGKTWVTYFWYAGTLFRIQSPIKLTNRALKVEVVFAKYLSCSLHRYRSFQKFIFRPMIQL